ncbi:Protein CEBPZOS [Merluccius polli]|uniref:Protein CEBPZOS n=1 Tax=Merluccius polli TaxID=89951 RepID=A0AA47N0H8_MERPO|nr:Protein CEBPZOS [Merluccius polli]
MFILSDLCRQRCGIATTRGICRCPPGPGPPGSRTPLARRLFRGLVVAELAGVMAAYGLFHRMNTSQDFRSAMRRRFPAVLEVYYQSNEWGGVYGVREKDRQDWSTKTD